MSTKVGCFSFTPPRFHLHREGVPYVSGCVRQIIVGMMQDLKTIRSFLWGKSQLLALLKSLLEGQTIYIVSVWGSSQGLRICPNRGQDVSRMVSQVSKPCSQGCLQRCLQGRSPEGVLYDFLLIYGVPNVVQIVSQEGLPEVPDRSPRGPG